MKRLTRIAVLVFLLVLRFEIFSVSAGNRDIDPLPLSQVRYWAYQIQDLDAAGAVEAIVHSPYDMVVIDPTVTHHFAFDAKAMVNKIKTSMASDRIHRKRVIAYIDIGQAEEWRWYWHGHLKYEPIGRCKASYITQIQTWAPWVVACDPDGWAGNYPVAFWDQKWKEIVQEGTNLGADLGLFFDSMLDEVLQDGFDGVYLDWVEAWEMPTVRARAIEEGRDPATEMLSLIREIRMHGRRQHPDFLVIQQNASQLIYEWGAEALRNAVDGIAQEGVWWDGVATDDWDDPDGHDMPSNNEDYALSRLRAYRAAGFPVFICEYAVQHAAEAYQKAKNEGFVAYATRRSLSRLTTTPPFNQTGWK